MILDRLNDVLDANGVYDPDEATQNELLASMDSIQFVQLVVSIENEFDIGIPDEYLLFEYFDTKDKIVNIVERAITDGYRNVEDIVRNHLCIGCLACVSMCPLGELEVDEDLYPYPVPVKPEKCDNCSICLLECPAKADKDQSN